ncbi:5'/3'-nucleotidase SurE [Gehongia tenuis]|uniref:5'-nucleotidase SurE n=1 Tax=Gehongia tenuis TaxID=2763655 RepID=A0A926HKN9_9FIRM|nr:5'/3'-nucleotidase SurE [Gehongia tenuis]MBC8531197.1 5'/3'-nucleotidase SurE [Gehongia tenuis]
MRILVTNDDGIRAPGIRALVEQLAPKHDITVVAPAEEQSAKSHSITIHTPLMVRKQVFMSGVTGYAVTGTPSDCVRLGVLQLMEKPDMVLSGINAGSNIGLDVLYSGTVSAALEGALLGYPSAAVSSFTKDWGAFDFERAAKESEILVKLIEEKKVDASIVLNLNVPSVQDDAYKGVKVAPLDLDPATRENYEKRISPAGEAYYWMTFQARPNGPDSFQQGDLYLCQDGYSTLTPLHFDLTQHRDLPALEAWVEARENEA